jgi:small subunit ribosomal protein S8
MSMTDPIADMLTRLRNSTAALKHSVSMPSSKQKEALAKVLEKEGYIESFKIHKSSDKPAATLEIILKYNDRKGAFLGLQRISKPGRRVYVTADRLPRVYGGMGVAVISTSKGLMTDLEARRAHVGGEVLCYVW